MRVLIVHNLYRSANPSGENRVVDQEAELLGSAGHEVVRYQRESDEIARFPLVKKAALPGRVTWSMEDRRRIDTVIEREAPQIIHVHNTFPLISPAVLHAARDHGVPVVATLHNFRLMCSNGLLFRDGKPCELCLGASAWPGVVHACYRESRAATLPVALGIEIHRRLQTWARGVSAFVALSEFARRKFVQGGLPAGNIHVKPNFVMSPSQIREGAGNHMLFLGRLSREKGADLLIEGWSESLGPLLIVGDGPERASLESRAATHDNSVQFLGPLPRERCMELLRDARALVVPSRWYEGFPVVVAEAYAHGVPVIGPNLGVFPEVVSQGETGLLFAPGDAESLAATVQGLADAPSSIRMGHNARRAYDERYTPQRNLELLLSIYERAIQRRAA